MELDSMQRPFSRMGSLSEACPSLLCFTPGAVLPSALTIQVETLWWERRGDGV